MIRATGFGTPLPCPPPAPATAPRSSREPKVPARLGWLRILVLVILATNVRCSFAAAEEGVQSQADIFLEGYNQVYQGLYTVASEAAWQSMTDVTPEHTGERIGAEQARAAFVGSTYVIERARSLLKHADQLNPLTVRQLRFVLRVAAEAPATVPDIVRRRIAAEARQSATLDGFEFRWRPPGRPPNNRSLPIRLMRF